jgi:hypothetical protein
MKFYDKYVKVLRRMYIVRFNGSPSIQVHKETLKQYQSDPYGTTPPFINTLVDWQPNKVRKHKEREEERVKLN